MTGAVERADEGREITVTTQPAEPAADLLQTSSDPADEHAAVAPAAYMVDEVPNAAVEILDRVGAPPRAVQRPGDAEALQREGPVQPLRTGMPRRRGECGRARRRAAGGGVWRVRRPRARRLHRARGGRAAASPREMLEHVATLVAPMDDRGRATDAAERPAEARAAVDDEEHCAFEDESAIAQVCEEALADGRVLGRALAQGVLLALANRPVGDSRASSRRLVGPQREPASVRSTGYTSKRRRAR